MEKLSNLAVTSNTTTASAVSTGIIEINTPSGPKRMVSSKTPSKTTPNPPKTPNTPNPPNTPDTPPSNNSSTIIFIIGFIIIAIILGLLIYFYLGSSKHGRRRHRMSSRRSYRPTQYNDSSDFQSDTNFERPSYNRREFDRGE
jgi:uncharacterized protein HemX